jgi:hypothetical protein
LQELARLLGFEPRPGVAAVTTLAYAVDRLPGSPESTPVPAGHRVQSVPGPGEIPQTFETVELLEARPEWNLLRPRRTTIPTPAGGELLLDGIALELRPGDGLLVVAGGRWAFRRVRTATVDAGTGATRVDLDKSLTWCADPTGELGVGPSVFAFRLRAPLFGHNAPDWHAMSDKVRERYASRFGVKDPETVHEWPGLTIESIDTLRAPIPDPPRAPAPTHAPDAVHLDAGDASVPPGSLLVLADGAIYRLFKVEESTTARRELFALSSKTVRVKLMPTNLDAFNTAVRSTVAYARPEELPLAPQELTTPMAGATITLDGTLDRPPAPGSRLVVRGISTATDAPVGEVVDVESADGSPTVIRLVDDLRESYRPATVSLFANVADATHGETVAEVLGSGDAGQAFQAFPLSHAPVTYVAGETEGARSTLEVWVNSVRWREVPSFLGAGPRDQVFVTRRDEDGRTILQFGDGITGARLPSGVENVRAIYRKGLGRAGCVRANQLTLLLTQPLGVRSVTNPLPAAGGEDPESLESIRRGGPLAALTLGRVVSLADYRDFAAAFPGVAKAEATWVWDGHTRGIALTLAGVDGQAVPPDGPTAARLRAALDAARDRLYPVHLRNHRPVAFQLAAGVLVAADREPEAVLAAVRKALAERFGFDARALGQDVTLAEVVAAVHSVPGVVAANVTALYRPGNPAVPNPRLAAARPEPGTGFDALQGAELLVLDPTSLADVRAGL